MPVSDGSRDFKLHFVFACMLRAREHDNDGHFEGWAMGVDFVVSVWLPTWFFVCGRGRDKKYENPTLGHAAHQQSCVWYRRSGGDLLKTIEAL